MNKRPVLIQASDSPIIIFVGAERPHLRCEKCKHSVLVENYVKESMYGIGLQCGKCAHVTQIASVASGEILPANVITISTRDSFEISQPIRLHETNVISCDEEIQAVKEKYHPLPPPTQGGVELSLSCLDKIITELDVLSDNRFLKHIASARRALSLNNPSLTRNLLAWSLELLRQQLLGKRIHIYKESVIALAVLVHHNRLMARWKHHALIKDIANDLSAYYYHTFLQMIAATYLYDHGNYIGIKKFSSECGVRSADLYIRRSSIHNLYLEVKAPEALDWTKSYISEKKMRQTVERCLSRSRGQISESTPGILVIGAGCIYGGFHTAFQKAIQKVLNTEGRKYPAVAAIMAINLHKITSNGNATLKEHVGTVNMRVDADFRINVHLNKGYYEENPVELT